MNNLKYIGMDVHRDSTTVVVLDAQGKELMEVTLRTEATILVDFICGLRGTLHLTHKAVGLGASDRTMVGIRPDPRRLVSFFWFQRTSSRPNYEPGTQCPPSQASIRHKGGTPKRPHSRRR